MGKLADGATRKWNRLPEKVISSLVLEATVQGLDNHHLLGMSQRELGRKEEGLDEVTFQDPSPLAVSEFKEQGLLVWVRLKLSQSM